MMIPNTSVNITAETRDRLTSFCEKWHLKRSMMVDFIVNRVLTSIENERYSIEQAFGGDVLEEWMKYGYTFSRAKLPGSGYPEFVRSARSEREIEEYMRSQGFTKQEEVETENTPEPHS